MDVCLSFHETQIYDLGKPLLQKWCVRDKIRWWILKYFPSLREYILYFRIDRNLLKSVKKEPIIMHPGPINRGVEISSDVADSTNSIILNQVENGVAIRMAILYLLSLKKK